VLTVSSPTAARIALLSVGAFAYFVLYPEDLVILLRPVETILHLSFAISPWLYGVVAAAILAWVIVLMGRRRSEPVVSQAVPPPS
jgi:hypothetical protein